MLSQRFAEILKAVISVALSYIFSLANCDFQMKLMVLEMESLLRVEED